MEGAAVAVVAAIAAPVVITGVVAAAGFGAAGKGFCPLSLHRLLTTRLIYFIFVFIF